MKKIIEWILFGHAHDWRDVYRENYYDTSYGARTRSTILVQKCVNCNQYKQHIISAWLPELNVLRSGCAVNKKAIYD